MDIDVSGWILEFLLRQNTLTDQTLNNLINILPLPNNHPRLKKTLILRKLESDIKKHTFTEHTLQLLEQIEQLDHMEGGSKPSDVMKAAYSTVAIHCVTKLIKEVNYGSAGDNNDNEVKKQECVGVVKKLLGVRVSEMERCGVGLVGDELVKWVRDVVEGGDVCEDVLGRVMEVDVVESVGRYVDEEKEKMGGSFLEVACEAVLRDDALSEAMGLDEVLEIKGNEALRAHEDAISKLSHQSKDNAPTDDAGANSKGNEALRAHEDAVSKLRHQSNDNALTDDAGANSKEALRAHEDAVSKLSHQSKDNAPTNDAGANSKGNEALRAHEDGVYQSKDGAPTDDGGANSKGNETSKAHVPPTHKHVVSRRSRRAKIVDPMENSHDKYDFIPTPEVSKVQEALESSSFELHAAVKDPLPDALRLAESLKVSTSGENEAHELVGGNLTSVNDKAPSSSHDRKGKALEADGDDDTIKDQNKNIKPSLFERNHTAHTTEWSDSIDSSEEGSPTRPHLPSPQKRKVSPLSVYKMDKLVRQRKKKRWTPLEEDTLRTGVQKYGKGYWKLILGMYRDIFEDRTEVDLKDKWRNLTR